MTDAEAECYREQYGESEVEDVLRYLEERKEDGASSIAIARLAGCNIPLSHAVDILKNLEEQGKARRVMKGRLELWYPPLFLRARREYDRLVEEVGKSDALTVINYQRFIARHNLAGRDDKPWIAEETKLRIEELKNAEVSD